MSMILFFKLCIRPGAQGLVYTGHWKGLGVLDIPCRSNYRLLLIIYTYYMYSLQEHCADSFICMTSEQCLWSQGIKA